MSTESLQHLLERHRRFWDGDGDAPFRRVSRHNPLGERGGIPLAGGGRATEGQFITPDLIDPHSFYPGETPTGPVVNGDFLAGQGPPALCWTEAIAGCQVQVVTGGPWAVPFLEDWSDLPGLKADAKWLDKLDQFVDYLARRAGGRYPIVEPLMRGPIDIMASVLGHERMCLALSESPEEADELLSFCADVFIETARRRLERTPVFAGGWVSSYGIWAPGRVVRTQVDNGTLVSPETYRERVLPHDRRVIEAFDFPLIHVHSGCLHLADELARIEALKVIQVSIDYPGGPLAAEVMPTLRRVIERKCLIVTGPVTPTELRDLEALTPPGRLCLQVSLLEEN